MSLPEATDEMFAPPVNRAMKVLDRSFFQKTIPTSAARIFNPKDISRCRKELTAAKDTLPNNRVDPIRADPDADKAQQGVKCLLLRPEVVHTGESADMRKSQVHPGAESEARQIEPHGPLSCAISSRTVHWA